MVWFFDREGQRLRYEIRRRAKGEGYELVAAHPDGRTETQQMLDPSELLKRCAEMAEDLRQHGWRVG